jgi:hypothetical protein
MNTDKTPSEIPPTPTPPDDEQLKRGQAIAQAMFAAKLKKSLDAIHNDLVNRRNQALKRKKLRQISKNSRQINRFKSKGACKRRAKRALKK